MSSHRRDAAPSPNRPTSSSPSAQPVERTPAPVPNPLLHHYGGSENAAQLLSLQRLIGNRAVARMVSNDAPQVQRQLDKAEEGQPVHVWLPLTGELARGNVSESYNVDEGPYDGYAPIQLTGKFGEDGWEDEDYPLNISEEYVYDLDTPVYEILKDNDADIPLGKYWKEALVSELGLDESQIASIVDFNEDVFATIGSLTAAEFSAEVPEYTKIVAGYERKYSKLSVPSGGSGGSSAWATSKVRAAAKRIAEDNAKKGIAIFAGGQYTIHHKVSRHNLRALDVAIRGSGGAASALESYVVNTIGPVVGSPSLLKILLNMPANLEVGPPADKRIGDPGSGFDGNIPPSPRSSELSYVDSMISTGAYNWGGLLARIKRAHENHMSRVGSDLLTAPNVAQWKPKGMKFERK